MRGLRTRTAIIIFAAVGAVAGPFLLVIGLTFTTIAYEVVRYSPPQVAAIPGIALGLISELLSYAAVPVCFHGVIMGAVLGGIAGVILLRCD